jgi:hypothetical protein
MTLKNICRRRGDEVRAGHGDEKESKETAHAAKFAVVSFTLVRGEP